MFKVIINSADYESFDKAVDVVFKAFPLDLKGKRVLIKPNVLRASKATEAICTHPAVLRAVVKKVESMGPGFDYRG